MNLQSATGTGRALNRVARFSIALRGNKKLVQK